MGGYRGEEKNRWFRKLPKDYHVSGLRMDSSAEQRRNFRDTKNKYNIERCSKKRFARSIFGFVVIVKRLIFRTFGIYRVLFPDRYFFLSWVFATLYRLSRTNEIIV